MKELIKAKIKEIKDNLSDLYSFLPKDFNQYPQIFKRSRNVWRKIISISKNLYPRTPCTNSS